MNAATQATMFSSASVEWSTPQGFYDELNEEFGGFELDPAATAENHKAPLFYTKEQDGLTRPWAPYRTFCNPPYGLGITGRWVKKAHDEWLKGALVVVLIPSRTDTAYFHDFIVDKAEVRFVRGRLKFLRPEAEPGKNEPAPFPSLLAIYRPGIRPTGDHSWTPV